MSTENNPDGPYRIYPQVVTSLRDIATQALNNDYEAAEALIARGGAWINRERVRVATAMVLPGMMVPIHTLPAYAHPISSIKIAGYLPSTNRQEVMSMRPPGMVIITYAPN